MGLGRRARLCRGAKGETMGFERTGSLHRQGDNDGREAGEEDSDGEPHGWWQIRKIGIVRPVCYDFPEVVQYTWFGLGRALEPEVETLAIALSVTTSCSKRVTQRTPSQWQGTCPGQ